MFNLVPGVDFTKATGRTLGDHCPGILNKKTPKINKPKKPSKNKQTKKTTQDANTEKNGKEIGGVVNDSKKILVGWAIS